MLYRFGPFELNTRTAELCRDAVRLPLQPQPAAVLSLLVARAGELVTREEIQSAIWPDRTVDYEQGLNYAVRRIRSVLDDDSEQPRYVETLPKRGYRFVAAVERVESSRPPAGRRRLIVAAGVAGLLVIAVAVALAGRDRAKPGDALPATPSAREAYLVARDLVNTRDREALRTARRELGRVLESDPDFEPALAGLGEVLLRLGEPAAAREPLARALTLDRQNGRVHHLIAQLLLFHDWKWDEARAHLDTALRLHSGNAGVHQVHAYWLTLTGQPAAAEAAMRKALELDPLSSYVLADAGWIDYWAGRLSAAAARCARTLEIDPDSDSGRTCLLFVRIAQQDPAGAREAARALMASRGATPADLATLDPGGPDGLAEYWSWEARRLEADAERSPHDAFLLALTYAQSGRADEAFRELEAARVEHTPWMLWLEVEPLLQPLRTDPRWPALVASMAYP